MKLLSKNRYLKGRIIIIKIGVEVSMFLMEMLMVSVPQMLRKSLYYFYHVFQRENLKKC